MIFYLRGGGGLNNFLLRKTQIKSVCQKERKTKQINVIVIDKQQKNNK